MKKCIAMALALALAATAAAQDTLVAYRLNLVKHPVTKKYGYAFKSQNINSPIRGATSTAINLLGSSGSQLISKEKAEAIDWAIPPQYDDAAAKFSENLSMVKVGGKVGFIDLYNRFVIEPDYDDVDDMDGFHQGLAAVRKDGKWGYIDKEGNTVIPFTYDAADPFDEDLVAAVKIDDLWGAIDITGRMVVAPDKKVKAAMTTVPGSNKEYRAALKETRDRRDNGSFDDRLAAIREASSKTNRRIARDDRQQLVYRELAIGDSVGIEDQFGRVIVPPRFSEVTFDKDDGAFIVRQGDRYGAYLYNGSRLCAPCFDAMSQFSSGRATVKACGVTGWMDTEGRLDPNFLYNIAKAGIKAESTSKATARAIYERILDINPEYAQAYNNIALLDIENADYNKGMRKLKLANELDPADTIIAKNLAWAKASRKERRRERWATGLSVAAAVIGVAATTYTTYSSIHNGGQTVAGTMPASSGGGSSYDSGGGSSGGGSGKSSSRRCNACNGSGKCSSSSGTADRYFCHGRKKCQYCNGAGFKTIAGHPYTCEACKGNQMCKYCNGSGLCPTCHGTGTK